MKIKILSKDERKIKFVLEDATPQFANALRRIMMSEVPVLAVDTVTFYNNDSALYDEVMAHRFAMVPLWFDTKAFKRQDECDCEGKGCSNCQIVFVVDKKGPVTILSKDMKSADAAVAKPVFDDVPIAELFEDQRLKAEATAKLGLGKDHAKWQASRVWYSYYPVVEQKAKVTNGHEVEQACPHNAVKVVDGKVEVGPDCDLSCHADKAAKPEGAFTLKGDDTKFVFTVESISGLSAEEIVLQAADILKGKAKEFGKEVEGLK
ncbi:MAG: DNA-directed RNA polymerase subunit D [Candidatus Aenigmatarchaeota archaeon]